MTRRSTGLDYCSVRNGPWRTADDVELAALGWVPWHNTARVHGYLNDQPPAEFEAEFYAANTGKRELLEVK